MHSDRLIIFDLGRVLVRICDNWRHACSVAEIEAPPYEQTDADRAAMHAVVCANEVGQIDQQQFCRDMATLLRLSADQVSALSQHYLLEVYPGTHELLSDLKRLGYRIACLSNTNPEHWGIMSDPAHPAFVGFERFDYAFASHLVRHRKPADAIYAHVESATGFAPAAVTFFDDLPDNIAAASRRGWNAILIQHDGEPIRQIRAHLNLA